MYHCSLKSNRKDLQVAVMTDGNFSQLYSIGFENGPQNPAQFPVNISSFEYVLYVRVK
jgi:hypothetical protein